MKLSVLTLALTTFTMTSISQANSRQVLNCTGGRGGPTPAQAILVIEQDQNNAYTLKLVLTNKSYPKGISGAYKGYLSPESLYLNGSAIAGNNIGNQIILSDVNNGTRHLAVYSSGDERIEFGYGAHFTCK